MPTPPLSYGILLYPGFEVLDIAGPMEVLNTLTHRPEGANLTLSVIGRPVDDKNHPNTPQDITPADPDTNTPGFNFQSQQIYKPTHTFHNHPPLDILLVPGGFGAFPASKAAPEVAFVREVFPKLNYLFTVCNGAAIAAAAGVLDGRTATTNKALWKEVVAGGPRTRWVAHARWVVDSNVWTTSGVSAGIDGMLAFLESVYPDSDFPGLVNWIANGIEHRRVTEPGDDPFANVFKAEDVEPKEE